MNTNINSTPIDLHDLPSPTAGYHGAVRYAIYQHRHGNRPPVDFSAESDRVKV